MIKYTIDKVLDRSLWQAYSSVDYGKAVPEKGYKGFRTFLEDVTGADKVEGTLVSGFTLYFNNKESYTWFLLRWG